MSPHYKVNQHSNISAVNVFSLSILELATHGCNQAEAFGLALCKYLTRPCTLYVRLTQRVGSGQAETHF